MRVYTFGNGAAEGHARMVDVLGGKGAGLAGMAALGVPVPPGFTIPVEICAAFHATGTLPPGLWAEILGESSTSRICAASCSATASGHCWCRCGRAPPSPCRA
ncbi:MAG: PEP/pyruvate-binding domain-containing protein [bacterium]